MKNWLNQNKVFLIGLLQLLITTGIEVFDGTGTHSTFLIAYSFSVAVLTYFANNLRGQWASIITTVLNSVVVVGSLHDSQTPLTREVILLQVVLPFTFNLVGLFNTSPAKSRNYEHSQPIVDAKLQAKEITEAKKTA
jgi:hypothetical protein